MRAAFVLCFYGVLGCASETPQQVNGSGLLVNFTPSNRPQIVGALDFDLLGQGQGKACVNRNSDTRYWMETTDAAKHTTDDLTSQAIAAATMDAISRLEDTDSILLTRVVTESKGPDRICATVVGRGVRLIKASSQSPSMPSPAGSAAP